MQANDQVVCIDEKGVEQYVKKDQIYTVDRLKDYGILYLKDINFGFHAHRFQTIMLQPNDKVVCIDDAGGAGLKKDQIYTIDRITPTHIWIKESPNGYLKNRFKKIESSQNQCTCTIQNLMIQGCKCGQIEIDRNRC